MTERIIPTVTLHPLDGGYRYRLTFPIGEVRNGDWEASRAAAVFEARGFLRRVCRVDTTASPALLARTAEVIAAHLVLPGQANQLAEELDRAGLLAGGFPCEGREPAAEVAQIVRWRNLSTPEGCYQEFDYVRAADALAGELEAAGLLASLPVTTSA